MTTTAPKSWNPRRFDVRSFAVAGSSLSGEDTLDAFERLSHERHPDGDRSPVVRWTAIGETRPDGAGQPVAWLRLQAHLALPVGCQRCLAPVVVSLEVDRWFRFVADEATAEAEDDACEEDVLALEPTPDLLVLIEDELLMELPLVPMHEVCPEPLPELGRGQGDGAPLEVRPNPFASLAGLKK